MTKNGNQGDSTFGRIQRLTKLGRKLSKNEQDLNTDKLQACSKKWKTYLSGKMFTGSENKNKNKKQTNKKRATL